MAAVLHVVQPWCRPLVKVKEMIFVMCEQAGAACRPSSTTAPASVQKAFAVESGKIRLALYMPQLTEPGRTAVVFVYSPCLCSYLLLIFPVLLVAACLLAVPHSIVAHMLEPGAVLAPQKTSQLPA